MSVGSVLLTKWCSGVLCPIRNHVDGVKLFVFCSHRLGSRSVRITRSIFKKGIFWHILFLHWTNLVIRIVNRNFSRVNFRSLYNFTWCHVLPCKNSWFNCVLRKSKFTGDTWKFTIKLYFCKETTYFWRHKRLSGFLLWNCRYSGDQC